MSQDYIALEWVKGEIQDTLQQAQQALEAYVEHPEDRSRLRFCLSYLHQVHGTLQMVEFFGAALLAEEMEAVALALTEGSLSNERDGLEVLMQAIIQLPHYLEHVKVGRRDLPVVLLPILNELRSTRGENFLSETSLFTPYVEHNAPLTGAQKNLFTQPNFLPWLRKTRQMLQAATLQLLQGRDPDLAKHYINKLFAKLNKSMGGTPQGIVWLPALAFSEWLLKQDSLPKSAKVLLRQLDQLLKTGLDKGVAAINRPPAEELLKNLLFYVARTDARGEAIRLVQKRFRLAEALPNAEDAEDHAMGAGSDAVSGALTALIEEISTIKDELDQVVRGSAEREPALTSIRSTVRQVADTMGMLGLGMPRRVMQEQESAIVSLLEAEASDEQDSKLLDVAGALLYVEATLNGMIRDGDTTKSVSDSAMSDAQRAVLREARNVLEQVKDGVVSYIAHQWSTEKLQEVPALLHSIEGSLNMIPMPRVAVLLSNLSTFVQQALLADRPAPEWGVMDMVAEVLSGVEYYLERYSDESTSTDIAIIERAENTLSTLMQRCGIESAASENLSDVELPEGFSDEAVDVTSFSEALGLDDELIESNQDLISNVAEPDVSESDELPIIELEEDLDEEQPAETLSEPADNALKDADDDLIDDEIIEVFLEEAEEVTETLGEFWPVYRKNQDDSEALTTVRRSFHTLKGSGRMVKADDVSELAWSVENMFNRVLDETISVNDDMIAFVDRVIEQLPGLIEDFRAKRAASIDVRPYMDYAFATAEGNQPATLPGSSAEDDSADPVEEAESDVEADTRIVEDGTAESNDVESSADDAIGVVEELASPEETQDTDAQQEAEDRAALLEIFIAEAEAHLAVVDEFVTESNETACGNQISDALQRALHTLKGSAHMAELAPLADVASVIEKLTKELRAFRLPNTPELASLLNDASVALRSYLTVDQLMLLEDMPEAPALIERAAAIETEQLQPMYQGESPAGISTEAISHFLASGMDSLIEADELLQTWQEEDSSEVLDTISADLSSAAQAAEDAGIPAVKEMALALHHFYQGARNAAAHPEPELVAFISDAHEELLNMMDCLAAGQDLPDVSDTVRRVRDWQFPESQLPDEQAEEQLDEQTEEQPDESAGSHAGESSVVEGMLSLNDEETPPVPEVDESSLSELEQADIEEQEDDLILDIFLEEAEEITEAIESIVQKWEKTPEDLLPVAELQRELHTLKGGARMAELPEVADLCHELETLYERLNDGVIELSEDTLPLAQSAHDLLFTQLQSVKEGKGPENPERMIEALKVASQRNGSESSPVQDTAETDSRAYTVQSETADESDREIVGIFLEEAGELMEALDEGVEAWRAEPSSTQGADELLRVLHTLKGGARLAGLSVIGDTAHNFESDIQKALSREARFDDTFFMHLNERQENLQSKIDDVANLLDSDGVLVLGEKELVVDAPVSAQDVVADTDGQADAPTSLSDDVPDESQAVNEGYEGSLAVVPLPGKEVEMAPERPAPAMAQQRKAPTELVKVSADLLDSLVNLAGETAIGRGRLEEQVSDFAGTLSEMDQTLDRMRDQLRRLDIETEAQVLFRQERHGPDYEDFDPLEMDRYSAMQQLSRALMESASDLIDLKETLSGKTRDAETLLLQQSRVNTELQEGLMKTRMVPFQRMVPRLRRIVRQVSLELNKQVELRVNNADGEMDRTILERMISPLEHMVRNAVDHGIESGEQRRAAGKPEKGSIELDIRRDGGDVVLTLRDDGQGINLDAVLKKARERGMVPDGVEPTEHDIMQFILQPGFSTAEVITQISGRGVGMDVVSSEIKQMGGSVEIRSEAGTGSEFEVRLPFTVSVNRALMVRIGEDLYAVPLNNIQGIVRASVAELQNLYDQPEGERFFNYAGRDYQLGYLGAMLDEHSHPKISGQHMPLPLLLVRGQVPFALQADALLGSREIVVKSLGPQFAGVRGISGGTILGDGSVVIILDLPAMIRTYTSLEYQQAKALDNKAAEARHEQERRLPKVLVVDDSVTVRKVTTRLLERHGMEVLTAKDGMHAMEVLQDVKPDVMLLDIEMPRMDGFEVASLVRHDERLKDLPIIMITSRTGDKHRERARSIGVNEYMGKPFQEEALLENINAFLGHEVY